jgi:hydrogenase maturation factor HypF (carbamoyltransferase family)
LNYYCSADTNTPKKPRYFYPLTSCTPFI